MLAGAPGTAAAAAAASVLALEGGEHALAWGVALYVICAATWTLADAVGARLVFRGKLPSVPWRPNLMFNVYATPRRNLLDRVSRRMAAARVGNDATTKHRHRHRAFATVVGNCPFAHVGGAALARAALDRQPVKSPLYRAFEPFAGVGIFTAEGDDWAAKRSEVLGAFATAGLEPLAAASTRAAAGLTAEIDAQLAAATRGKEETREGSTVDDAEKGEGGGGGGGRGGDRNGLEVDMLPRLQRATLRATFEYLAGVDLPTAAAVDGGDTSRPRRPAGVWEDPNPNPNPNPKPAGVWEDEYLAAATDLRALIPARARSVWMLSDWAYALSPVGRLERARIREARRLPELALRAAVPGSPLDHLRRGPAHSRRRRGWSGSIFCRFWGSFRLRSRDPLLDEATTLLFAGHDTQSATLSWALLRLAGDPAAQRELRASLTDDPAAMESLGTRDVAGAAKKTNAKKTNVQPAWWRTSAGAPVLEACLRETLRLHPVAPFVARKLTSDAVVASAGDDDVGALTLPAGCAVGVWLHAVHRDPTVWVDPDSFVPSRWLVADSATSEPRRSHVGATSVARGPASSEGSIRPGAGSNTPGVRVLFKGAGFMPFATGPRACAGQHLAWVYMRVVLARLVCAYEVRLAGDEGEGDALTPSVGFTVTPANAARVRLAPVGG